MNKAGVLPFRTPAFGSDSSNSRRRGIIMGTVRRDVRFLLVGFASNFPSSLKTTAPWMFRSPFFRSTALHFIPMISERRRPCRARSAGISIFVSRIADRNVSIYSGWRNSCSEGIAAGRCILSTTTQEIYLRYSAAEIRNRRKLNGWRRPE